MGLLSCNKHSNLTKRKCLVKLQMKIFKEINGRGKLPYSLCKALVATQPNGQLISLIRVHEGEKEQAQQVTQCSVAIKARPAATFQLLCGHGLSVKSLK